MSDNKKTVLPEIRSDYNRAKRLGKSRGRALPPAWKHVGKLLREVRRLEKDLRETQSMAWDEGKW